MRKITWVLLLIILALLAFSNPKQAAFREYMKDRIEQQNKSGSDVEESLRNMVSDPIADLISESTPRSNYIVCSIFRLEVGSKENVYLGIAGKFIPIKENLVKTGN